MCRCFTVGKSEFLTTFGERLLKLIRRLFPHKYESAFTGQIYLSKSHKIGGVNLQDILIRDVELLKPYKVNRTKSREEMWRSGCPDLTHRTKSNCLTTKQDRWGNAGLIQYEDFCRYLTEVECERLQTLPDGYTYGIPSTQRYKALGNGWTVDVIAHILSFIPR